LRSRWKKKSDRIRVPSAPVGTDRFGFSDEYLDGASGMLPARRAICMCAFAGRASPLR
jgi:hypothetical protein